METIRMRYRDDGRMVEGPIDHLSKFIEAGLALPVAEHQEAYAEWAEAHGKPVPDPEPIQEDQEPPESTPESTEANGKAPVDIPDQEEESQEEEEDIGVPLGYEIRRYGQYYVAYDPDDQKVGKGQTSYADAVALARDHAGF